MRVNYSVNQEGRLQSITEFPLDESKPVFDLPGDFNVSAISDYLIKDGALHFDPVEIVQTAAEKIAVLKRQLADTDYITAKAVDAMTSADSLTALLTVFKNIRTEYADVLAQRAAWRKEINDLEEKGDDA